MAKIAILSDVHSNLPALDAVLGEVADEGIGRVVFGGDIVGYGAQPRECVERVRQLGGECVVGNHDHHAVVVARRPWQAAGRQWRENPVLAGIAHAARELSEEDIDWLERLEWTIGLPGAVIAHASLHEPDEWHYLRDEVDAAPTLDLLREPGPGLGFFGHTHHQEMFFERDRAVQPERIDALRVRIPEGACCAVVVGSVGQPRSEDKRAGWVTWDPGERIVEFRRTAYPAVEAARAIVEAGLPALSAARLLDERQLRELAGGDRED